MFRDLEKLNLKLVSLESHRTFNETCINNDLLPTYTNIYIYIYIYTRLFIYIISTGIYANYLTNWHLHKDYHGYNTHHYSIIMISIFWDKKCVFFSSNNKHTSSSQSALIVFFYPNDEQCTDAYAVTVFRFIFP